MTEDKDPSYRQAVPDSSTNEQGKKVLKIVLIALVVLIVLGAIGTLALGVFFTKGIEHALEQSSSSVEFNEDDSFTDETELPDGFPEEIPLFVDSEVIASRFQETEDGSNFLVTFKASAEPETIRDFYTQALRVDGWKVNSTTKVEDKVSIVAEREDLQISVNIVPSDREGEAHYTITADGESLN